MLFRLFYKPYAEQDEIEEAEHSSHVAAKGAASL
jgi:hypothetical protein